METLPRRLFIPGQHQDVRGTGTKCPESAHALPMARKGAIFPTLVAPGHALLLSQAWNSIMTSEVKGRIYMTKEHFVAN